MLTIYFLLLTSVLCQCFPGGAAQTRFPNIGFLGRGYDILRANPRPLTEPLDSGFVAAVFDMTSYDMGRLTADGRHLVPDYTDIVECTACQLAYQSKTVSGAKSYKNTLSRQITAETHVGVFGFKFSFRASESYMKTVDETSSFKNVLVDTAASCMVYCAQLRMPLKPTNLDEAFVEAVRLLPPDNTSAKVYFSFLRNFGTHVVSGLRSGSLFWQRFTFSGENYTKAEKEMAEMGIETAAGFAFIGATFGYKTSMDSKLGEKFSSLAKSMTYHSLGAPPPTIQGLYNTTAKWLDASKESPMPVEFRLIPITALLRKQFIPNDQDIDFKRDLLTTLVEDGGYCRYLASITEGGEVNCDAEPPDNLITWHSKPGAKSNFGGTYYKAGHNGVKDLPNHVIGVWDCPLGYTPILTGGGSYSVNCPAENRHYNWGPMVPGYLYYCRNGTFDPQGAFHGFITRVNYDSYGPSKPTYYRCNSKCQTALRDNLLLDNSGAAGKYQILVAYWDCEYVYASFTPMVGAYVGGFYLASSQSPFSWINPATGVTSCPTGYKEHLMFSQSTTNSTTGLYPFESYVCLLQ